MKFFDFVFLHRQWARDQTIVTARIDRLKQGWELEEPVSILIFPEGTVVSENTRGKMRIFAEKMNIVSICGVRMHIGLPISYVDFLDGIA
jgi:lysocardiolipin and lysophospholipid acyltransferase